MMYKKYKIKDLAIVNPSKKAIKDLDPNTNVSFIPMDYVSNEGTILKMETKKYKDVSKGFTYFEENDILFAKITPCMENGKGGLVTNLTNFVGFGSTEFHVIRANTDIIDPKYLCYIVHSKLFRKQAGSNMTGSAGQKRVPKQFIENYELNVPNKIIQLKVVELLDMMKTLIDKRKESIAKLDELAQAVFLNMFGDPVVNKKEWKIKKLGDICTVVRGGSPRPIDQFLGGTIPWIKIGDATKGDNIYLRNTQEFIIEEGIKKSRFIEKGSLIFANCGVSLGFARIITFDGCIHDGWLAFQNIPDYVNKIFLLKLLNHFTNYFRKTAPDGTQPNLNTTIMKNFEVILPDIILQNKFADIISGIEFQKNLLERSLQEEKDYFQSLLQQAFKGELKINTEITA